MTKTVHAIAIVLDILLVVLAVDHVLSTPNLQNFLVATPFFNFFSFWVAGLVVAWYNNSELLKDAAVDMAKTSGSVRECISPYSSCLIMITPG